MPLDIVLQHAEHVQTLSWTGTSAETAQPQLACPRACVPLSMCAMRYHAHCRNPHHSYHVGTDEPRAQENSVIQIFVSNEKSTFDRTMSPDRLMYFKPTKSASYMFSHLCHCGLWCGGNSKVRNGLPREWECRNCCKQRRLLHLTNLVQRMGTEISAFK